MELTQNETVPEAFRRKRFDTAGAETAEATAEPAAAEPEDETAAAEEQAPAAAEAVWNDTDGEGDEKNAGDL